MKSFGYCADLLKLKRSQVLNQGNKLEFRDRTPHGKIRSGSG